MVRAVARGAIRPRMDLNRIPLFSLLAQKMNWLGERQKVLAQNVANADTPGFQPRDLAPFDFGSASRAAGIGPGGASPRLAPAASDPRHLAIAAGSTASTARRTKASETTLSGNGVSLDQEIMKSADTAMDYQLVASLYRKQLGMLRAVLSRQQ